MEIDEHLKYTLYVFPLRLMIQANGQPTIRPVPESWRADGIEADAGLLPVMESRANVCRVDTMNKVQRV